MADSEVEFEGRGKRKKQTPKKYEGAIEMVAVAENGAVEMGEVKKNGEEE